MCEMPQWPRNTMKMKKCFEKALVFWEPLLRFVSNSDMGTRFFETVSVSDFDSHAHVGVFECTWRWAFGGENELFFALIPHSKGGNAFNFNEGISPHVCFN